MQIIIKNEQNKVKINKIGIKKFIHKILYYLNISQNAEIGLTLVDNQQIQILNKKYRKLNRPTDVLAFAMLEGEGGNFNPEILGDIVISTEKAFFQAPFYNHTFNEEFKLLIIHGILHLLGYDHIRKKDKKIMEDIQEELILKSLWRI